jgi:hypothetical protein
MLGKKKWKQWAKRVSHGMTPDQQTDSRTGKEKNKLLKEIVIKGIRRQIKDNC